MRRNELIGQVKQFSLDIDENDIVYDPRRARGVCQYFKFIDDEHIRLTTGMVLDIDDVVNIAKIRRVDGGMCLRTTVGMIWVQPSSVYAAARSMDITTTKAMPRTDSELNDLIPTLYPDLRNKLYYDVLNEREMIDQSLIDPAASPGSFTRMTSNIEYRYYDDIERKLKAQGYRGAPPAVSVRYRVLMTKFYDIQRNNFEEWVNRHPWDGIPRVDTWFKDVFGASAPLLAQYGLEDLYLAKVARAWFVGGIRRMRTETTHEIVPVFIGKQSCGKTTGLRYTAGRNEWFVDTVADITTPQGIIKFLDNVRGKVVVELAESTQIRSKDQESLKAFITKSADQYRKPYARTEESFPRHFILAASSNLDDVFTDLTGNRRYFPMNCSQADLSYRTQYNVEQVWAEAKEMYEAGEEWFIVPDWLPAKLMQAFATQENSNVDMIDNWLDDPENGYSALGSTISKYELMEKMFCYGATDLPRSEHETAWRAWTHGTKYWIKSSSPKKYRDKSTRCFVRTHDSNQGPLMKVGNKILSEIDIKAAYQSAHMVTLDSSKYDPCFAKYMSMVECKDINAINVPIPDGTFTQEQLDKLEEAGLIIKRTYEYGRGKSESEYVSLFVPKV